MLKVFLFSFYILISLQYTFGQSFGYRHFTSQEGLPSSEVYHIFQDSKGYIWFSTNNGASRYDGYQFKNYSVNDGLPDNTIFEIYEDWQGRIWFISFSAKLSYLQNGSIHVYKYNQLILDTIKRYPISTKLSFYVDRENSVYFGEQYFGIVKVSAKGQVYLLDKKYILQVKENRALVNYCDCNNKNCFVLFDSTEWKTNVKLPNHADRKIALFVDSTIFLSNLNFLYRITKSGSEQILEPGSEIIWLSHFGKDIWIGTRRGVFCYENNNFSSLPKYKLLPDHSVSSVLKDNEGGMWFSTLENGVFYLPNLSIESVTTRNSNLPGKAITKLLENNGNILCAVVNGELCEYKNQAFIPKFKINQDSKHHYINDICGNNEIIYLLTYSSVYKIPIDAKTRYKPGKLNKMNNVLLKLWGNDISIDNQGFVWLLNRYGLCKIHKKGELEYFNLEKPPGLFLTSLLFINKDTFLLGTNQGIWEFNVTTKKFRQLDNIHPHINGKIHCLAKDTEDNSIWIGTKERGAFLIRDDSVFNFSTQNGLSSDYIIVFFKYKGSMWVGTKGGGVYKISPAIEDGKFIIDKWTSDNGLSSNEINDIIVNDTCAFLATNDGLNILNYNNYKINLTPPPVFIEKLKINNKDTVLTSNYRLKYSQNLIDIRLIGLAYKIAGKLKYKYRLLGNSQDTTWVATLNPNIQLAYLSPGNYIFQAKAINENNIESKEPIVLFIGISPPFWKTWWFIVVISIVVVCIVILYARSRLREIERRNELEQEIEKYRQQALTQQMNPHFIFNSLNSIQLFIYKEDKKLSNKYLSKFSGLIRIILENSQHQAISLQKEFEALILYLELEEMRLQGKLSYNVQIDKNINTSYFTIPPLLIQPFAENSIWHGIVHKQGNGHIKISLKEHKDGFLCTIEDDGVGRKKAQEIQDEKRNLHKSLGTQITEKRLELLNKLYGRQMNITYTDLCSGTGVAGTRVEIKIPRVPQKN